jgi:transaldolase
VIRDLAKAGIKLNVTAILTLTQVRSVAQALHPDVPSVVSIFAGRIADTGVDPVPILREGRILLANQPRAEILWASVREVLNIFQAEEAGCDIITVPHDILAKATRMVGTNLTELSLDTVKMFTRDAAEAGFSL